jgi:hypothetical protein
LTQQRITVSRSDLWLTTVAPGPLIREALRFARITCIAFLILPDEGGAGCFSEDIVEIELLSTMGTSKIQLHYFGFVDCGKRDQRPPCTGNPE